MDSQVPFRLSPSPWSARLLLQIDHSIKLSARRRCPTQTRDPSPRDQSPPLDVTTAGCLVVVIVPSVEWATALSACLIEYWAVCEAAISIADSLSPVPRNFAVAITVLPTISFTAYRERMEKDRSQSRYDDRDDISVARKAMLINDAVMRDWWWWKQRCAWRT